MFGLFVGACWGGFVKSKEAYFYFIENNQATIFKSTMQAKVGNIFNNKYTNFLTLYFITSLVICPGSTQVKY